MISSIVGLLGESGAASYGAANAGLDALAQDRRVRGAPSLSIAWAVWSNTGLAKGDHGNRVANELARQGLVGIAPERGTALFGWLCGVRTPYMVVLPIDWAQFSRVRVGRGAGLYRHLLGHAASDGDADRTAVHERLASAPPAERRLLIENIVLQGVAKVLKLAPARIDPRKDLVTIGLSSLLAMELRAHLEAALGRSLSSTLVWGSPSVATIAAHLSAT
jgi:myxalamid-type polyketide synthase MxaE and MxaD